VAKDIARIANVNIQFFNDVVKNIPHISYSPIIEKNMLFVGFITNQNHNVEFISEGYFLQNHYTR
jgi:hypothetical protein